MARFASRFANYSHGVRSERAMVLADGQRQVLTSLLEANFNKSILTNKEVEQAVRAMKFGGRPIDRETEEHVSARIFVSGFDSEIAQIENDWTDEERELVERKLRQSHHYGVDHIELLPEPADKPWRNYDELKDPKEILTVANAIGVPLEDVIAYEKENANRPKVLAALGGVEEEAPVVIDAS